jgi:hypothetical protein
MKNLQSKFKNLFFILIMSTALISCSSDDGVENSPNINNENQNNTNSYSINIGGTEYSNAWEVEEGYLNSSIISTYSITPNGDEGISLGLQDGENNVFIEAGFGLNNNQALPIEHHTDGWNEDSDYSFVIISIGDIDYEAETGTAILSNLNKDAIVPGIGGLATYDLEIEGIFRKFDPSEPYLEWEEREQIEVTGAFQVHSNL